MLLHRGRVLWWGPRASCREYPGPPLPPLGLRLSTCPLCAPAAAIGAVFGIATCVSAQVRQKPDDPLNYFLGGCAGGLTLGARSESPPPPS